MKIGFRIQMLVFLFTLLPFTNVALAEEVFEFDSYKDLMIYFQELGYTEESWDAGNGEEATRDDAGRDDSEAWDAGSRSVPGTQRSAKQKKKQERWSRLNQTSRMNQTNTQMNKQTQKQHAKKHKRR